MSNKKQFVYLQVYDKVKSNIENNIWKSGKQIPTEHDLMDMFNVSRDTIRKALAKLLQDGYIYKQAGRGTFVRKIKSNYSLTLLESFSEQMKRRGLEPSSKIIKITNIIPEKYILDRLEVNAEEKVYKIERLRKADNEPMCYEIAFIPESLCKDLDKKIQNSASLYDLYENYYGLNLSYGDMSLEAKSASEYVSKVLEIRPKDPILEMRITVYLDFGRPLYYVEAFYIGEKYIFSTTLPRKV